MKNGEGRAEVGRGLFDRVRDILINARQGGPLGRVARRPRLYLKVYGAANNYCIEGQRHDSAFTLGKPATLRQHSSDDREVRDHSVRYRSPLPQQLKRNTIKDDQVTVKFGQVRIEEV